MAEGSSTSDVSAGCSESTLQLNIKTLDSRIYSFHVDKNIAVSAFKEKIASHSGVPVEKQRLIFRGKVLKDDHSLSEYNVENGDTLHLVVRQPQPPPGSSSSSGEATSNNGSAGQDSTSDMPRNRIGHIAHSIVLGTLNVGDRGEARGETTVPQDISQVIGAVLNAVGLGNVIGGTQPGVQTSQGNETEGSRGNAGSQSQGGNQFASQATQIPQGAASIAFPTLNTPIPDSLSTLTEFMNRMELALSQNGNLPNQPHVASGDPPTAVLPMNSRGLPTIEALSTVLRHAQRLLGGCAVSVLSHAADRIDQEGGSNDPAIRGQIQSESVQLGVAMQHLGAFLLELGRTILTLRMGRSSAESVVYAGPAVYISPSGPNPIMVQPSYLQTSSLFDGSFGVASNPVAIGPVGVGSVPRNVNIHIHTGASMVPMVSRVGSRPINGDGMLGERVNTTESRVSGQGPASSGINVTTTAIPMQRTTVSPSGTMPVTGSLQEPDSISSIFTEINAHLRRREVNENNSTPGQLSGEGLVVGGGATVDGMNIHPRDLPSSGAGQTQSHVTQLGDQKAQTVSQQPDNVKETASQQTDNVKEMGVEKNSNSETSTSSEGSNSSAVPIGLGLGGLQPKRRGRQLKEKSKNNDDSNANSQTEQSRAIGQQVLQSLATRGNENPISRQDPGTQTDVADAMSEMLQSPALDGLLSGMSQQTGVGSPNILRNMLQQFTQNPAMRNTVNQIAQQIDRHDLGSMFSGLGGGGGQDGQIDLSRMMQQMMPIVSQALGGISSVPQPTPLEPVLSESRLTRDVPPVNTDSQEIDLGQVIQTLQNQSSSEEIFHSLVDTAVHVSGAENDVDELCGQGDLVKEFMEMLYDDISRRLQDGSE